MSSWAKAANQQDNKTQLEKEVNNLKISNKGDANEDCDEEEGIPAVRADASLINKILHSKLVQDKSVLEILRKDPNSPLYSVKSFEELHLEDVLLKGIYDMGFYAPSKIQESALPPLLANPPCNMIAQSQSGTGKTAAFVLTMLSRIKTEETHPQGLCLAPTYELALQIGDVTKQMAKYMKIKVSLAVRGERPPRGVLLQEHIVIGTPGTLLDWCFKLKVVDTKKIKVFVLDEADVMIDMQGHHDQSIRIQKSLGPECQMLLFSATYDRAVMEFAEAIVPCPIIIKLRLDEQTLDNIKQVFIRCQSKEDKARAISNIYGAITIGQSVIFCHTRKTAAWLSEEMTRDGHSVAILSGDLTVEQRAAVISRFRDGKEKVLITTNVSARGIDVEQVTVVVNFDLPMTKDYNIDFDTYLHRIGRTGRFGKNGLAVNMIDGTRSMSHLKAIQNHFNRPIEEMNPEDFDEIAKLAEC